LAKKDFGEAERLLYIFTKEFGMIKAVARGVRYLKSKLRPNLDLFYYNNFSLIRAKDVWKITDANGIANIKNPESLKIFSRIAIFLTRMIKGEEKNDFIWRELVSFSKGPNEKDAEIFFIAKILKNLGYLSDENLPKKQLIVSINKAIKESML